MARKFIQKLVKILSIIVLRKYRPIIIGITGSVGKTSTKEAICAVLSPHFRIEKSEKNYNNEIGLPLTILGGGRGSPSVFQWLKNILKAFYLIIFPVNYPQLLVLEMGSDKPGDIKYLTDFIKPEIGVITAIGEIPVHVEFFAGPEEVAKEKAKLIEVLPTDGSAILNFDDDVVLDMRHKTKAKVLTFGFGEGTDLRASNYELKSPNGERGGVSFKLGFQGSFVPVRLFDVFGKQAVYAALAGAACGLMFGLNLIEISQALEKYEGVPGRMRMIRGNKKSWILDDTYNASPIAARAALETLKELSEAKDPTTPVKRKIAVLGDMLELGKFSTEAHQAIGVYASKVVDYLFTVGPRGRLIADAAESNGLAKEKIFRFDDSSQPGEVLEDLIREGDFILVKGSRSMRMEKVVEDIMAEPENARELLV